MGSRKLTDNNKELCDFCEDYFLESELKSIPIRQSYDEPTEYGFICVKCEQQQEQQEREYYNAENSLYNQKDDLD